MISSMIDITEVESSNDFIHEPLKDLYCVTQTESHERELENSEKSYNSGFRYVFSLTGII